jgi:hypothetical protein
MPWYLKVNVHNWTGKWAPKVKNKKKKPALHWSACCLLKEHNISQESKVCVFPS